MSFKSLLTQKCTINRKTNTKSGAFTTPSWNTVKTDVSCRINPISVSDAFLKMTQTGIEGGNDYLGFFFANEDIKVEDQIIWNDITLYARPVVPIYGAKNKIHHLEVTFGLKEK